MFVGVTVVELHLPAARNLKDKRRVVKALIDRMYQRYRVSIAETDFHDLHQRAEIAIAVVVNGEGEMNRLMDGLRDILEGNPEAIVTQWEPHWLEGMP